MSQLSATHGGTLVLCPEDASFVAGDMLSGFKQLSATDVSFGMKLLAPLSRRAYVFSARRTSFTGRFYDVYTERCPTKNPLGRRLPGQLSGRPEFHAACPEGTAFAKVKPGTPCGYELTPVEKLVSGDIVVSMPATVPQAMSQLHPVRFAGLPIPTMLTRISMVGKKDVSGMDMVVLEIDSPTGIILDGVAVCGREQPKKKSKKAACHES